MFQMDIMQLFNKNNIVNNFFAATFLHILDMSMTLRMHHNRFQDLSSLLQLWLKWMEGSAGGADVLSAPTFFQVNPMTK